MADPEDQEKLLKSHVVITEKLDGVRCLVDRSGVYSRDEKRPSSSPWDAHLYELRDELQDELDLSGYRVYVENMSVVRSIRYTNLATGAYVIAIQDRQGAFISWHDTEQFCLDNGLLTVPVLLRGFLGPHPEKRCGVMWNTVKMASRCGGPRAEGYVIRTAAPFHHTAFRRCVMKYVNWGHASSRRNPLA